MTFSMTDTLAINLSPFYILKCSFLCKLSETSLKPLKVLCPSIAPFLFIVKQHFILSARTVHRIFHRLYNHSYLVLALHQPNQLCLNYANVYFQYIDYQYL